MVDRVSVGKLRSTGVRAHSALHVAVLTRVLTFTHTFLTYTANKKKEATLAVELHPVLYGLLFYMELV